MRRVGCTLLIACALAVASCSSTDRPIDQSTDASAADSAREPAVETASGISTPPPTPAVPSQSIEVSPGVEQLTITGVEPGRVVALQTAGDRSPLSTGTADAYGSLIFRDLDAAASYLVSTDDETAGPFEVLDRQTHPDRAFYAEQRLVPGVNYIEMRDGTTLAANVVLPGPIEDGPYPTVVEYSGYSPADPNGTGFKDIFRPLGYAYVGVNIRGTGCSGGSFRYFEYAQSLDGYDAIETVAAQPWVFDNAVGMVGVSYPGISQLFVAQTQPPSLAAIAPFSVVDDNYNSTLYPGGLLNSGFAVEWAQDRVDDARPAVDPNLDVTPDGGQDWAKDQIAAGDAVCAANQTLRLQSSDLVSEIIDAPFFDSSMAEELTPRLFVDRIEVPTFVAGAWQDEQTGARFATMLDRFTGTEHLYATLMNGLHSDSIGPANLPRWLEFLDLYVAQRVPTLGAARLIVPFLAAEIFGPADYTLPADRFDGLSYDDALAAFESEPPIRILFEVGADDGAPPRVPSARFVEAFDSWPIPSVEATSWWFDTDGLLGSVPPLTDASVQYLALPDGVPATFLADESAGSSSDIWRTDVVWDWQEPAPGTVAAFLTEPVDQTLVMVGSASADLWVSSNLGDTDLEVTISEVRPDGQEMYVQSGWLRASQRRLDDALSTELQPVHTHRQADALPITSGGPETPFELARVEILPFAHVFRTGSKIRVSVDAPGGNRPTWVFDTISGGEQVSIGIGGEFASRVVLPVVPGVEAPADRPACGDLRGQPCRTFGG